VCVCVCVCVYIYIYIYILLDIRFQEWIVYRSWGLLLITGNLEEPTLCGDS